MSILIIYIAKEVDTKRFNGDTAHSRGELGFISLPYLTSSMPKMYLATSPVGRLNNRQMLGRLSPSVSGEKLLGTIQIIIIILRSHMIILQSRFWLHKLNLY